MGIFCPHKLRSDIFISEHFSSDIETKESNRNRTIIYIFITVAYLDITTLTYRFTCTIYDKNKFNNYKSPRYFC